MGDVTHFGLQGLCESLSREAAAGLLLKLRTNFRLISTESYNPLSIRVSRDMRFFF